MNMVRSLNAMAAKMIVPKNITAVIVVYFLLVFLFFDTAKVGPFHGTRKFFSNFLHQT